MTQALAFQQWSRRHGHQVVGVLAGTNRSRNWPAYFESGFEVPVQRLASPGFVFSCGRSVNLPATLWQLVSRWRELAAGQTLLRESVRQLKPDLIVNFLEPMVGWFSRRESPATPVLAIGHQFLLDHPTYVSLAERRLQQWGLRQYVAATGCRATKYALSFYRTTDQADQGCWVGPPLLREELFHRTPEPGDFLLVYLLNEGYRRDLEAWHARNPEIPLHCFYDRLQAPAVERVDSTLTFHTLHGERFLDFMARCRGVVCTAGFEAVSEAAWLGKPVLAVPVEGHIEQALNAVDAEHCGLAIAGQRFDLDRLLEVSPNRMARARFRHWMAESDQRLAVAVAAARQGGWRVWRSAPKSEVRWTGAESHG